MYLHIPAHASPKSTLLPIPRMSTSALAQSSHLYQALPHLWSETSAGGFGFENKPVSLGGWFFCLLARKPAGSLLNSSPPPPLSAERGSPCSSQLKLAWQCWGHGATGAEGRRKLLGGPDRGLQVAGQDQWFTQTLTLRLARSQDPGGNPRRLPSFTEVPHSWVPQSLQHSPPSLNPINTTKHCLTAIALPFLKPSLGCTGHCTH